MDLEKRKREDGGGRAERGREAEEPADEEVEEFFATLKRIHVAVRYFRERSEQTAGRWGLRESESSAGNRRLDLDLNSDPVCDVSESDLGS